MPPFIDESIKTVTTLGQFEQWSLVHATVKFFEELDDSVEHGHNPLIGQYLQSLDIVIERSQEKSVRALAATQRSSLRRIRDIRQSKWQINE